MRRGLAPRSRTMGMITVSTWGGMEEARAAGRCQQFVVMALKQSREHLAAHSSSSSTQTP